MEEWKGSDNEKRIARNYPGRNRPPGRAAELRPLGRDLQKMRQTLRQAD